MSSLPPIRIFVLALAALVGFVPVSSAAPHARVGPVNCDAGGAIVNLSNDGGAPARFVLLRDDTVVATHVVPAGVASLQQVVPVAEGTAAQVTARYGASYASSYVRRECGPRSTAEVAAAPANTADAATSVPYRAAPVVPVTSTRALQVTPPPTPAPSGSASDRAPQLEEPASSLVVLMLAALAALAVAGALAVALAPRRDADASDAGRRHETAR